MATENRKIKSGFINDKCSKKGSDEK